MGIKLIPSIKAIIHSSFVILIFTALFSNAWALETFANSKKDGVEVFTESKDWCAEEVRFIFKVKNQEQLNNEGLQLLVKKVGKLVESNCEVTEIFNISGGLTLEDLTYAATAKKSQDWNIENVEIDQDETQISQSTEQESKSDDETDENEGYVAPPTSTTHGHVPVISDKEMERCVVLYNEAERLFKKLNNTKVDNYSQDSVDNYNNMVNQHTNMTNEFNTKCAGKQSRSACETAKKLNKEQGLPYQDC